MASSSSELVRQRPKAPPRTQETRSREARERLLAATIEVLIERGYNGLSTKEVALRSGLSNGALMHHYSSKAELVVAATAAVYEECVERGQKVARTAAARKDPIAGFISDCVAVYFDWPFIAALEVLMVARTDELLMQHILPVMQRYRQLTNELWLGVFEKAGIPPARAELVLNYTLNMVRGMAVNSIWHHDADYRARQLKDWAAHAAMLCKA